jgi:hypothetical protein
MPQLTKLKYWYMISAAVKSGPDWTTGVQFPAGVMIGFFSLRHRVQNGSGAHSASYTMGTRGLFTQGKSDRRVKLTSHHPLVPRLKCMELYIRSPIRRLSRMELN